MNADTRYTRAQTIQISDLVPGDLVAVTAKSQPDGSLQASLVNVFPKSTSGSVRTGQFELPSGSLMTNATIQQVSGDHFTAQFPGGTVTVTLAAGGQVMRRTDATVGDIKAGTAVSIIGASGVARQVTIVTH